MSSNIRSLGDLRSSDSRPNDKDKHGNKVTESFTGGEKSGLAVENPTQSEVDSLFNQGEARGSIPEGSRVVTMYKNGFQIDDGEFRSLDTPENMKFVNELLSGYAPKELRGESAGSVHVALKDKRSQVYEPPPPPKYTLFSGSGTALSSSSAPSSSSPALPVDAQRGELKVDDAQPTTALQLRFHNGTSVSRVFNHTHTIADLHAFFMSCAPVDGPYTLLTGFPLKSLDIDPNTTLKDAGLLNQVVVQRRS